MSRRDPFAGLNSSPAIPEEPAEAIPEVLARRPSRAKRNREWEREHPMTGVRDLPPELIESIRTIAAGLGVSKDEIIRAFLEYGLQAYQQQTLQFSPQLKVGKMTLYPAGETLRGKKR